MSDYLDKLRKIRPDLAAKYAGPCLCFNCGGRGGYTWTCSGHVCRDCYGNLANSSNPADWRKIEP